MTLVCDNLTLKFGGLCALNHVSLKVVPNQINAIIGPNGAGKTTLFNILTGIYSPTSGTVSMNGTSLVGLRPDEITKLGLARTFQNIRLFRELSRLENIMISLDLHGHVPLWKSIVHSRIHEQREADLQTQAENVLKKFGFESERFHEAATNMSYGKQRLLEIARAYATGAKVILLDEPAAGLNHHETADLMTLITLLKNEGLTIVLIEHDMKLVMGISDQIFVLDHGELIAQGLPHDIQTNQAVLEAYLGVPND